MPGNLFFALPGLRTDGAGFVDEAINRGAMVRIPLGNEKSARIEVRSIAPDAMPSATPARCGVR